MLTTPRRQLVFSPQSIILLYSGDMQTAVARHNRIAPSCDSDILLGTVILHFQSCCYSVQLWSRVLSRSRQQVRFFMFYRCEGSRTSKFALKKYIAFVIMSPAPGSNKCNYDPTSCLFQEQCTQCKSDCYNSRKTLKYQDALRCYSLF